MGNIFKIRKIHVISFVLILLGFAYVNGQVNNDNYYEIIKKQTSGNEEDKVMSDKQFRKFLLYWRDRIPYDGKFSTYYKQYNDMRLNYNNNSANLKSASTYQGLIWKEIGINKMPDGPWAAERDAGVSRIDHIAFHPFNQDTMLVCSPVGGLFKSTNGGLSWESANTDHLDWPGTGLSCALFEKYDPDNTWYVATGSADQGNYSLNDWYHSSGIYRTTNGGQSWEYIGLNVNCGVDRYYINQIIQIPNNAGHLIAATSCGIYETINATAPSNSVVWTRLDIEGNYFDVQLKPGSSNLIYCAQQGVGAKVFEYNLLTEASRVLPMTYYPNVSNDYRITLRFSESEENELFILIATKTESQLIRYNLETNLPIDKGNLIDRIALGRADAIIVDPEDANNIWFGDVNPIYVTTNGMSSGNCLWSGLSTYPFDTHDDIHYFAFSIDRSALWVATDGGVYKSTDDGNTFVPMNTGLNVGWVYNIDFSSKRPDRIIVVHQDVGTILYEYDGLQWNYRFLLRTDGYYVSASEINPDIMTFGKGHYSNSGYKTINGGISRVELNTPAGRISKIIVDDVEPNIFYGCIDNKLYKSFDFGNTWNLWSGIETDNIFGDDIAIAPSNNKIIYLVSHIKKSDNTEYKLYKTITGGGPNSSDWELVELNNESIHSIGKIQVDSDDPNKIWFQGYSKSGKDVVFSANTQNSECIQLSTEGIPANPGACGSAYLEPNSNGALYWPYHAFGKLPVTLIHSDIEASL